ncbi:UL26.5 [Human alphaherpesvirus 1]|nr:capsid scaffold protein [Human alphaherpesvirus 1]QAU09674.1 UL26.5 [Human alphaherpesvirus 1]UUB86899.1 UL26.5 [Human alphaherpesvirus 1]UXY90817.1 UL26.5 [Human alphaherpesvirus 1]WKR17554.1 capsid scaffold protein [Human alphaherpesvirus 1]
MNPVPASGTPAPAPPGDGSYLWIPASHYNQLVAGHAAPQPQPHSAFGFPAAAGAVAYGPHGAGLSQHYPPHVAHQYPGVLFSGPSPLEAQIAALVGAIAADRQAGGQTAAGDPGVRGSGKRRRYEAGPSESYCDQDEPDADYPYYPGEARGGQRGVDSRRAARQSPGTNETITALMGAVTSLQQELAHMRARTSAPYGMYTPVAHYRPQVGEPEPTTTHPALCPPEAVYRPPSHSAPYGPPQGPASHAPTPPYAPAACPPGPPPPPCPSTQTRAPLPTEPAFPPAATGSQPEASNAEAGALVNASSAAHVDVDTARAADLFVSQMMGAR